MTVTLSKTEGQDHSSAGVSHGKSRFVTIALLACALVQATIGYASLGGNDDSAGTKSTVYKDQRQMASVDVAANPSSTSGNAAKNRRDMSGMSRLLESEPEPSDLSRNLGKEDALVKKIAEKLQPVALRFYGDEGEDGLEIGKIEANKDGEEKRTMVPHQFLHLHHMKTGGTSIDRLLRCAMTRLKKEANYIVPYFSIHECSRRRFSDCLTDKKHTCRAHMQTASVMSYCSALKFLDEFGWWHNNNEENKVKAFTVLRHPVDRVWSMFRFQTKNCFKCQPLKDIYEKLEKGEDVGLDQLCLNQLKNHEVNNLLSTEWPLEVSELDYEKDSELATKMVQEAIDNMKGFFTVIGITEELPQTVAILGKVFPWMDLEGSEAEGTTSECSLPHANASPSNNGCGELNTHWDLPEQPDQETVDLILKYNALDMELYESAVAYFQLQKQALEIS